MPAATPSKSRIQNAIQAIQAAGLTPGEVVIAPDGSLRVQIADTPAPANVPSQKTGPKKWGEDRRAA
ncbi:hypothetical protein DLJ49_18705 [Rhodovulum sp. 12E13]|uniref:hypothetical protein n=1 Tax=Rhodovulum sp. 12E13 TaxID=2203891 RepID=UPI000E1816A6|nr:hypothetical protein [Rhodovulum sp. 12E13]RDC69670.1 hypothetical protein DLJ49_18705 [Rhodovulum sp. 12E13]